MAVKWVIVKALVTLLSVAKMTFCNPDMNFSLAKLENNYDNFNIDLLSFSKRYLIYVKYIDTFLLSF